MTNEQFIARLIEKSKTTTLISKEQELKELAALYDISRAYALSRHENNAIGDLIELTSKIPNLVTFISFDPNSEQDKESFCQAMINYCEPDESFRLESEAPLFQAYLDRVATGLSASWVDNHAAFFDELLLSKLPKTDEARMLLVNTAHMFAKNSKNTSKVVVEIHKFFLKNNDEHLYVPDCIGVALQSYVNKEVFETFRPHIEGGSLFYYSAGDKHRFGKAKITCHEIFDQFYSPDEVSNFTDDALERGAYACSAVLKRFSKALNVEQSQSLLKIIIDESFCRKSTRANQFKDVRQDIVDAHAEFCVDTSPWCYISLSEAQRIQLLHKVNFETHLGLLIAHPHPEKVDVEFWKKAITEHEIAYSKFPEHLVSGDAALTEDEWFDLIKSVKGGNNKIFKALVKHYNEIVTESLLTKVATLEGTTAANHKLVASHVAKLAHEDRTKAEFQNILEVINTGDAAKIANKISFMVSKGMGGKDMLERIVVAIQASSKAE
ncbi:hypothetical protein OTK49_02685 [Vibrio coralliirubri]|uniref:hypothetical protein n=1 Tax=Vibrio coralliirubri TaxID=1516159 RepID=UPI0022851DF9|nr:hypothetical protein [Vibrio coralliirubri]MCY9861424.1 hypothetical protein [Vibrio coralliirubri]